MGLCIVVVPCYNEKERLNIEEFRAFVLANRSIAFLFVDDGSTDGTRELLDELGLQGGDQLMVRHLEQNRGKAEAVRRGMQDAFRLNATYVGYWDADLATPLSAILNFIDVLDTNPAVQVVLGARVRLLGRHIVRRPLRHYLGRIFATVVSGLLGVGVYDTQCGAKMFRLSPTTYRLFEQPFASKWIFDVEILARFLHSRRAAGLLSVDDVIHEIPLMWWEDVPGSKVKLRDFVRAVFELGMIHHEWLRKGYAATSRGRAICKT
jgi:dolichyl-phosphate beta-glucosyltransferase